MSDLVERLRHQIQDDHARGCEGRCYSCDCGYDLSTEGLLGLAADRIEALEAENEAFQLPGAADQIVRNWFDLGRELNVPENGSVFETVMAMKTRLAEAEKVIEPFANVAEHDIGGDEDNADIFWPISNARYSMAGRLRVGDLRAARAFMEKAK